MERGIYLSYHPEPAPVSPVIQSVTQWSVEPGLRPAGELTEPTLRSEGKVSKLTLPSREEEDRRSPLEARESRRRRGAD